MPLKRWRGWAVAHIGMVLRYAYRAQYADVRQYSKKPQASIPTEALINLGSNRPVPPFQNHKVLEQLHAGPTFEITNAAY